MRKHNYKFDEKWREAIRLSGAADYAGAVRMVREYIEQGTVPAITTMEPCLRGAWVVIRAAIDARQRRNARARERRALRRQQAAAAAAADQPDQQPNQQPIPLVEMEIEEMTTEELPAAPEEEDGEPQLRFHTTVVPRHGPDCGYRATFHYYTTDGRLPKLFVPSRDHPATLPPGL